jgi:SAM-dependent methyltransferase
MNRWRQPRLTCPNCGCDSALVEARKYLVTELRRCPECRLLYRAPTDPPEHHHSFYNDGSYRAGFTTHLPDASQLQQLTRTNFSDTAKDYSTYINILCQLGVKAPQRLFDFGCSWGYGSYQLERYGLEVVASEISIDRRNFARRHLNVRLFNELDTLDRDHPLSCSFDCFFAAHVLEHVPAPKQVIAHAAELLRPGGVFVAFVPNGCASHRQRNPNWNKLWGEPHPNVIDDGFLRASFERWPRLFASSPYDVGSIRRPRRGELVAGDLSGGELLFVASKPDDPRAADGLGRASQPPWPKAP